MNNNSAEYKRIYRQYRSILLRAYEYYQTLSMEDIDLLLLYKNFEYRVFNGLMGRGEYLLTEDDIPYQQSKREVLRLAEIILNAPKTTEDIVVYRGTSIEFQKKRGTLNEYVSPVIMSVSLLKEVALYFLEDKTCCLYQIFIPAGTPVLPTLFENRRTLLKHSKGKKLSKRTKTPILTQDILRNTVLDYEWELLIPPYTTLQRDRVYIQEVQRPLYFKRPLYSRITLPNRVFDEEQNIHNVVRSTKQAYGKQSVSDSVVVYEYSIQSTPTLQKVKREITAIRPTTVTLDYAFAKQLLGV